MDPVAASDLASGRPASTRRIWLAAGWVLWVSAPTVIDGASSESMGGRARPAAWARAAAAVTAGDDAASGSSAAAARSDRRIGPVSARGGAGD